MRVWDLSSTLQVRYIVAGGAKRACKEWEKKPFTCFRLMLLWKITSFYIVSSLYHWKICHLIFVNLHSISERKQFLYILFSAKRVTQRNFCHIRSHDKDFTSLRLWQFMTSGCVSDPGCIQFPNFLCKGETWAEAEKCILYNPIDFKLCCLLDSRNAPTEPLSHSLICFVQLHAASNLSP